MPGSCCIALAGCRSRFGSVISAAWVHVSPNVPPHFPQELRRWKDGGFGVRNGHDESEAL